jgi:hypothetical protein
MNTIIRIRNAEIRALEFSYLSSASETRVSKIKTKKLGTSPGDTFTRYEV